MVDAILLVKISEWENHRVPVVGAGSPTRPATFALYDPKTKALLWIKKPREQRFAAELDASSANVNYDETGDPGEGPTSRPATRRSPPIWSGTPSRSSAR